MPQVVKDGMVVDTGVKIGSKGWLDFLESNSSFRYEGTYGYTATKQNNYWYASRKYEGKLYRKYIGTTNQLNADRLNAADYALVEMMKIHHSQPAVAQKSHTKSKPGDSAENRELKKRVEYLTQRLEALEQEVAELRGKLAA